MKKILLLIGLLICFRTNTEIVRGPKLTEYELNILPQKWETCYQYAERRVNELITKYWPKRIVGSIWLSEYWAHHYYGAIEYRNYTWQANRTARGRGGFRAWMCGYC